MDTINRLLKKQAPKRRGKISAAELSAAAATAGTSAANPDDAGSRDEDIAANSVFVRWVSDRNGSRVGVPGEWLGKDVKMGRVFKRVEEV